jgi:bifunctional non-homologous end joining protein LigD
MAVHVEDHPLAYGSFEGTIPANQYGAGDVIVWDRGTWHPEGDPAAGYRAGKLKFRLDGEKLHGTWMLVRMHGRDSERQEPWLLIKDRDEAARPAAEYSVVDALPNSVLSKRAVVEASKAARPRCGQEGGQARNGQEGGQRNPQRDCDCRGCQAGSHRTGVEVEAAVAWRSEEGIRRRIGLAGRRRQGRAARHARARARDLGRRRSGRRRLAYEIKFDGYRVLARIEGGEVRLLTRNGNDWTAKLKGIAAEIDRLGMDSAWLDGEIVVLGEHGASDFAALQNAFDAGGAQIRYFAFDLPFYAGHDLRQVALGERRALLGRLLADADGIVRFSQDFESDASEILRNACRLHLEGVIGKRLGSAYVAGRTRDWIKLKCTLRRSS